MVIRLRPASRSIGMLSTELVVSLAILALALIPISFGFILEIQSCRIAYSDAVAMQILDGEMEILAAGEWKAQVDGHRPYPVRAEAARNLPPGQFMLSLSNRWLRLEWKPGKSAHGRPMVRDWRTP